MSYTPEEQLLTKPIAATVAGIDAVHAAILERCEWPSEWPLDHLDELQALDLDLMRLRQRLVRLRSMTQ